MGPRGVPQIEVTFDVNADGILKVTATEKGGGKTQDITISNEKGRLSEADIKRMVDEAAQYKAQDDEEHGRVSAITTSRRTRTRSSSRCRTASAPRPCFPKRTSARSPQPPTPWRRGWSPTRPRTKTSTTTKKPSSRPHATPS